ncbi:MAG: hypothetical protein OQJ93_11950 [Ignavibacteriaceae bacterium]|nr:hypothetical protein [Ignavibacteriaceae bacterium]
MKTLLLTLIMSFLVVFSGLGQDRTDEKKWTIDPETGDTIYTESVAISQTEDITPRNSMIIINPLKFLLFYNISYYHKLSDQVAIGGGVQMPTPRGINGFGANAEVRLYPSGKNLRGFYFAPNISYNSLTDTETDETLSLFSMGGLVGWQWFPGDQFAIGLGIGADYYFLSDDNTGNDDFEDYSGMVPALRFDIGYAW